MAESPKPVPILGQWLREYAKDRILQTKSGELQRVQISVSLHRRFRGVSLSDRVGRFIPGGTGLWRGDDPEEIEGVDLKCINITKPTVKGNMSMLGSANIAITNDAANKEPKLKGAANVADGIAEYLDGHEEHWSDRLTARVIQTMQTGYGAFIHARHNPLKKSEEVESQEWHDEATKMPGTFACGQCGAGGPFEGDDNDQTKCPQCGQMAEVVKPPEDATIPRPGESDSFNPGDNETAISSCFEHRIDERKTQGGNVREAKWFEHHYLVTESELKQEFGNFDFGAKASEWCYALKWKWALETGDDVFHTNTFGGYQSESANSRRERQDWYVLPEEYSDRIEPADYELKNDDEVVFSIKRGERLVDKYPDGFCFTIINDKVAPCWQEVDFRNEWAYCSWTPDAHSFWGQPLVELIELQDEWNTLWTIDFQHRERNSLNQIVYNSLMFDADAWEQDVVPTAEGYDQSQGLDFYFKQLQALPMNESVTGLDFIFKVMPYLGAMPPEAIGADPAASQDTYHGQLLRKQSVMGQLQPPGASLAECKVSVFRHHFRIAQDTWPLERFEYIKTRFGEEWKPDDIQAFLDCNLDRDIITTYAEGSEVPTSRIEKVIDMEQAIQKYIDAGTPPPPELLKQYFELKGLDYDMGGMEADERLADARYQTIKKGVQALSGKVSSQPVITIDSQTGQPILGPSMLVQQVMAHPQLTVKAGENHQVHIDFYVAQEKALMADEMPNMDLVDCLDAMIQKHKEATVGAAQEQSGMTVAAHQPEIQMQQQLEAQNQPPTQQPPDPQAEADIQAKQSQQDAMNQAALAEQGHEHAQEASAMTMLNEHAKMDKEHAQQASLKAMEIASKERQAKMQGEQKAKLAKEAAKNKPKVKKAA